MERLTVAWLKRRPRFISHFVPTSSSWLNLIERWFAELTSKRVRRGSFFGVDDLQSATRDFLNAWSEDPKPFVWTAIPSNQTLSLPPDPGADQTGCTKPRTRKMANGLSS
jgi:transposase